jgi:hypothetical protein
MAESPALPFVLPLTPEIAPFPPFSPLVPAYQNDYATQNWFIFVPSSIFWIALTALLNHGSASRPQTPHQFLAE